MLFGANAVDRLLQLAACDVPQASDRVGRRDSDAQRDRRFFVAAVVFQRMQSWPRKKHGRTRTKGKAAKGGFINLEWRVETGDLILIRDRRIHSPSFSVFLPCSSVAKNLVDLE
jgi:hypothetical protein